MVDVSVIIVNWNTEKLIGDCLNSIIKNTHKVKYEVFVVDNNSSDKSVDVIKRYVNDDVHLIKNDKNEGFAKANNIAIKKSEGKYIFLLNPDTIVLDGSIDKMVEYLDANKDTGIVGCKLLNKDGTLQESCRQLPNMKAYSLILLKLHHLFPNAKPLRDYFMKGMNYDIENEVEQVMGAALMYRRDVLGKNPSFLDEDYWIWFEEVDFCCNVIKNGYKVMYIPSSQIIHYKAQSFKQLLRVNQQKKFNKSIKTYFKKNGNKLDLMLLEVLCPISIFISWIIQIFVSSKVKGESNI